MELKKAFRTLLNTTKVVLYSIHTMMVFEGHKQKHLELALFFIITTFNLAPKYMFHCSPHPVRCQSFLGTGNAQLLLCFHCYITLIPHKMFERSRIPSNSSESGGDEPSQHFRPLDSCCPQTSSQRSLMISGLFSSQTGYKKKSSELHMALKKSLNKQHSLMLFPNRFCTPH